MATPAHAKLNRLLSIRTRLIEDLEHHIEEIFKFDEKSNKTLISYRTTALEKALKDLVETCEALEDLTQYHALENVADIQSKNRQIQDQYLMAKLHIVDFVDNDSDLCVTSTTRILALTTHENQWASSFKKLKCLISMANMRIGRNSTKCSLH